MSGSTDPQFGSGPAGSATEPCPLGQIHVEAVLPDGATCAEVVRVALSGPDPAQGSVAPGPGVWSSPKILPGEYTVEAAPGGVPEGFQPPAAVACTLPPSSEITVRLVVCPWASLPVEVLRGPAGSALSDVTVVASWPGGSRTVATSSTTRRTLADLPTEPKEVTLDLELGDLAPEYEPWAPATIQLKPGPNPAFIAELQGRTSVRVTAVDSTSAARPRIPIRAKLTPAGGGPTVEAETDPAQEAAVFRDVAPGTYAVEAVVLKGEHAGITVQREPELEVRRGEKTLIELTTSRSRSRIVPAEYANEAQGLLKDLLTLPYDAARREVRENEIRNVTLVLPMPNVAPFSDIPFEPDDAHTDDAKEAIAITGTLTLFGQSRKMMFLHTYRPNRIALAIKLREWTFKDHFPHLPLGDLADNVRLKDTFLILAAGSFEIDSDDLPSGVSSFFGAAEIEVKTGANLYGSLDVSVCPALDTVFGWLGIEDKYVNLQGILSTETYLALGGGPRDGREARIDGAKEVSLSAVIPAPIPAWGRSPKPGELPALVKGREFTLEVACRMEGPPLPVRLVQKGAAKTRGSAPPAPPGWKLRFRAQDELLMPFPEPRGLLGGAVSHDATEIKVMAALEVQAEWAEWTSVQDAEVIIEYTLGATSTSQGEGDFRLTFFNGWLGAHDLKLELNATKQEAKISAEFDLGRYDRVGTLEVGFDLRPAPGSRERSGAVDRGKPVPAGDLTEAELCDDLAQLLEEQADTAAEAAVDAAGRAADDRTVAAKARADADEATAKRLEERAGVAERIAKMAEEEAESKRCQAVVYRAQARDLRQPRPTLPPTPEEIDAAGKAAGSSPSAAPAGGQKPSKRFWHRWQVVAKAKPALAMALKDVGQDLAQWIKDR